MSDDISREELRKELAALKRVKVIGVGDCFICIRADVEQKDYQYEWSRAYKSRALKRMKTNRYMLTMAQKAERCFEAQDKVARIYAEATISAATNVLDEINRTENLG